MLHDALENNGYYANFNYTGREKMFLWIDQNSNKKFLKRNQGIFDESSSIFYRNSSFFSTQNFEFFEPE